ncbi:MAG: polyprenyl synthetase family protein [Chthoniobacterales bacterium]
MRKPSSYSQNVEAFAPTGPKQSEPSRSGGVADTLANVAKLVAPYLEQVDARILQQAAAFDPAIEGYVSYAIGGRGKRLRPMAALLAGGATGEIKPAHVDLAVIVELIHVATLVHDDIMDEADRRRGQPTVNARWGNSLSVLLGDCLFAHALNLSASFDEPEISRAIARTASEVCSGEMIQTQRRFDLQLRVEDYLRIVEMKTGSLFAVAAELAAKISGADTATIATLQQYGMRIGTAYQIFDDCLDLAGTEARTGKTLGTDLRKGKFTLPVLKFLKDASEFERARCSEWILEGRTAEVAELLRNGASNGTLNASIATAVELIRKGQAEIDALPSNVYTDALDDLGDALIEMLDQLRA